MGAVGSRPKSGLPGERGIRPKTIVIGVAALVVLAATGIVISQVLPSSDGTTHPTPTTPPPPALSCSVTCGTPGNTFDPGDD